MAFSSCDRWQFCVKRLSVLSVEALIVVLWEHGVGPGGAPKCGRCWRDGPIDRRIAGGLIWLLKTSHFFAQ